MRTLIAGFALATVGLLLGGCAGGGFGGSSPLPSPGMGQMHPGETLGGPTIAVRQGMHPGETLGGPTVAVRHGMHPGETLGGPTIAGRKAVQPGDVLGGPTGGKR